jgi:DNA-binding beta-propeller fold protein YncE
MTLGSVRRFGNGPDTFNGPTGVVFLPNGDFIVSDGYWNSRLVWFDKDGKFLKQVGTFGREPGQIGLPHGMGRDSRGRLLIADLCPALHPDAVVPGQIAEYLTKRIPGCRNRLQVFDKDGKHLAFWATQHDPLSITVSGDRVFVGQYGGKNIEILDAATGKLIEVIEGASVSHGHQVAVDGETGDVYVASVYPEHGGVRRGPDAQSLRRLTRR